MIQYFTEVSISWLAFYMLYILLLRRETFFEVNRWYLIFSLFAGILLPLIQLFPTGIAQEIPAIYYTSVNFESLMAETDRGMVSMMGQGRVALSSVLIALYILGATIYTLRFLIGLYRIAVIKRSGRLQKMANYSLVISSKVSAPFSFMDNIYVNEHFLKSADFERILQHELTHVQYRHSYDLLMVQVLGIIFWWNPLLYLIKKEIKESHEYMADAIAKGDSDPKNYGHILLGHSSSGIELALTHQFFNSHLKNRIIMLYRKKSASSNLLRYLSFIPCMLLLALLFSSQDIVAERNTTAFNDLEGIQNVISETGGAQLDSLKPSDQTSVYKVVEEMPRFPGCENLTDDKEKNQCSKEKLMQYIIANLKYPESAMKNNTEGKALIKFVVDTDGSITDIEIMKNLADGCGEEAKRVVASMNNMKEKWIPGRQKSKPVKVEIVLPFQFKL